MSFQHFLSCFRIFHLTYTQYNRLAVMPNHFLPMHMYWKFSHWNAHTLSILSLSFPLHGHRCIIGISFVSLCCALFFSHHALTHIQIRFSIQYEKRLVMCIEWILCASLYATEKYVKQSETKRTAHRANAMRTYRWMRVLLLFGHKMFVLFGLVWFGCSSKCLVL